MNITFLSHASTDEATTREIRDALLRAGIATWTSFIDIKPGSHWDESIEAALKSAPALVVVVTKSSVESRYVRAEVEAAITANKTVVPVVVEQVNMPLRWATLQHIHWQPGSPDQCATAIATVLPANALSNLRSALDDESQFDKVRELVLTHPEWLPMEFHMSQWYSFRVGPSITTDSVVDCFAARLDTGGPRAILTYLTSPNDRPFSASGGARPHMRKVLAKVRRHIDLLRNDMSNSHPLAPQTLFAPEAHHWRHIPPHYGRFQAYVVAGRRAHYEGASIRARDAFVGKAIDELYGRDPYRSSSFEVLSYDRLLQNGTAPKANPSDA